MARDSYDGVVYDLDGTLVRLAVDWAAADRAVRELYRGAGREPDGEDLWALLGPDDPDLAESVERAVAERERAGAREGYRLPLADELVALDRPAGVCSLNCEDACRVALDVHDLTDHVATVVGRDTTERRKPDPQPLLETVDRIGLGPDDVVFVGDSETDEECARRAGVDFEYVGDGPTDL